VAFETALNFVWLALGVFAFCSTLRARRTSTGAHGPAWLHVCGVALIIAALFPYVSATDDVLRIQHLQLESGKTSSQAHKPGSHENGQDKAPDTLIRLYEIMDAPVIGTVQSVNFSFTFVALVVTPALQAVSRYITFRGGRSPPLPLRPIHTA
jgi:hypothetical protein